VDFFFDTSLIFLALVVVLIITAITGIILARDVARFALRRKRDRAGEIASVGATAPAANPGPSETGGKTDG
jgi:uncharacterized membrane-anchored protein